VTQSSKPVRRERRMSGKKGNKSGKRVRNLALKSVESSRVTGGRDKSQASHSDMVVLKHVDQASTKLFKDAV
jgi:hypothetical protein